MDSLWKQLDRFADGTDETNASGAGETEIKIRKLCRTMPKMAVGVPRLFFPDVHTADV